MLLSRRVAAAVLVSVLACDQPTSPDRGAGLFLDVEGSATAALDSGKVIVRGPTNKTVKVMPGTTVGIDGLMPGTYTIALQGFDSGGIARFFQTSGVTVMAHQNTTVTAPATQFAPFVPAMNALPPSGMGTTFTVSYNSIAGAASYEVEAATDQAFTANRVAVAASETSAQVTVGNPGTYYVRVRAIDMFQGRGRASPFQVIQVAGGPAIRLSETTANFGAPQGGGNPAALTVAVTNGGGGTLSGLSADVSYTTGNGWLSANLNTTTAPSTLTLQPTTGSLVAGTYTATVSVASAVAGNSPQTVTVTFTVGTQLPSIVLSSTSRNFSATQGGGNPASQTVSVTNGGGGTLSGLSATVSYTTGSGWLGVATLNTTTAPSTLTIRPTTGSLAAGTYTATVSVASAVASNSPRTVSVTFTVAPRPAIVVAPTSASFTATQGGANPAAQTAAVTNGGGGTLSGLSATVSYTTGSGWLSATLSTTTAPSTLTLQPATGSLAAGTYTATVSVASGVASNSPRTVEVTFTVAAPPPSIVVTPASRTFNATQGGANPATQTVAVTNGGGGTLSDLSVSVSYSGSGGGWLNATLNTTTAPSTLTLQAATGSLAAGSYNATVSVASGVASNSPRTVSVTFTVTAGPMIVLTPTSRSFSATQDGPNPPAQTVAVTNGGGGNLNGLNQSVTYTAGQPDDWLDAEVNPKSAPSTLTLTAKTKDLPAGTYTATVSVTSGAASNSPQTVTVTFTVAPPPPTIVLAPTSITFNAARLGAEPAAQTVSVTNGTVGTLSGLSATISYMNGTGWLSATLSSGTAPSTLTLTATKAGLVAGTYRATVSVASPGASNSPRTVSVTFVVTAL